ncbi:hypothetical protein M5C99_01625 [Acidovorax sp. NCPPB 2350]|nr:hypothetical protein M5C99_01625 [Acidovorax sp. NCPPB 2350]
MPSLDSLRAPGPASAPAAAPVPAGEPVPARGRTARPQAPDGLRSRSAPPSGEATDQRPRAAGLPRSLSAPSGATPLPAGESVPARGRAVRLPRSLSAQPGATLPAPRPVPPPAGGGESAPASPVSPASLSSSTSPVASPSGESPASSGRMPGPPAAGVPGRPGVAREASALSAPLVDAAAAAASLASARLGAAPQAARVVSAVSGGLWVAAGALGEAGNVSRSVGSTGTNWLGMAAGAFSVAVPFTLGALQRALGYGAAASWAASGAMTAWSALTHPQGGTRVALWLGAGSLANLAAAGVSAAAVQASESDAETAARLQTVSSALWLAGAAAAGGVAWEQAVARRREAGAQTGGTGPLAA